MTEKNCWKYSTGTRINGCKLDGKKFGPAGEEFIIGSMVLQPL